jgi:hypothetical protein
VQFRVFVGLHVRAAPVTPIGMGKQARDAERLQTGTPLNGAERSPLTSPCRSR